MGDRGDGEGEWRDRHRDRERERERGTTISHLLFALQPGIKPATLVYALTADRPLTFWCTGQCSNQLSDLASAKRGTVFLTNRLHLLGAYICARHCLF